MKKSLSICLFCALMCVGISCSNPSSSSSNQLRDLPQILASDTLRVITMYGPASYFLYRDNQMGYEYELAKNLCTELHVTIQLLIAPDMSTMLQWLLDGKGDIIAYRIPYTHQNKAYVAYTKQEYISNQVVVQTISDTLRKNVLQLAGAHITVPQHSIYHQRLIALNDEIGGGIHISTVSDSISSDDLVAQVALHQVANTVTDDVMARLNKTYFGNIDYSLAISFPQRYAWVVAPHATHLQQAVNEWATSVSKKRSIAAIYHKYFEKSKYFESAGFTRIPIPGRISSFDYLFKSSAKQLEWDWRLLAAMAYKESKFNPDAMSWAGACGLMQLMPNTALSLGVDSSQIFMPDKNVAAATTYLQSLIKLFPGIEDPAEKVKFVLASYNAGPGHVFDARALATKYQKDPNQWEHVREYMLKKSDPIFYTDTVCRFGYCRGKEPVTYVDVIMAKYAEYRLWAK